MKNEKRIYQTPELELIVFDNEDLLENSGINEGDDIGMPKIDF